MFYKSRVAEGATVCIACAALACSFGADQQWFDRHFLPGFFVSRDRYIHIYWLIRFAASALGILLLLLRRPIARFTAAHPGTLARVARSSLLGSRRTERV